VNRLFQLAFVLVILAWLPCQAADIVLAQVAPKTGPLGPNGVAVHLGAKVHFDDVNERGGLHGNHIRFVFEDDQYKPAETQRLLQLVAQRDKPVLFLNLLGSASVTTILSEGVLEKLGIPALGAMPGSESLRTPGSPLLFHTQAGDRAQLRQIVSHLSTMGVSSIAVIYQGTPFGLSGLAIVEELCKLRNIRLTARVQVEAGADDLKPAAMELKRSAAQTYVMILAPNSGAALVRDVRGAGDGTPIYGMSYVPVADIVAKAGQSSAKGVALSQVTPNTFSDSSSVVREFKSSMNRHAPGEAPNQLHLIGYLSARIATEALAKAGASATPAAVRNSLKSLRFDAGGYAVDFSKGNVGSTYVSIGVIDGRGRLVY
jgi:branched-chain amino acid transport system substrate-binding protein